MRVARRYEATTRAMSGPVPTDRSDRLPPATLLLYALAAVGGVIGYVPLLTLLLPIKVEALGDAARYGVLAWCGVAGALAAGCANIAFGWLGDHAVARGDGRRGWLVAGVVMTALSFVGIVLARDAAAIVLAIVAFQIAVNAALAQIAALIAEEIPAAQKGVAAALLTLGNPVTAGVSALVVVAAPGEASRLATVAVAMTLCVLPLSALRSGRLPSAPVPDGTRMTMRRDLAAAWAARLLVQIAASGVGLYLLFYFEDLVRDRTQALALVSRLLLVAAIVPVPIALVLGRWSDRIDRRKPFLAAVALLATVGLLGMATAPSLALSALSYVAFASGVQVFLALNIGHAMLLLPDGARRGRDLGILNLANTLPQIIASALTWWSATTHGFEAALATFAALTLVASVLPLAVGEH